MLFLLTAYYYVKKNIVNNTYGKTFGNNMSVVT